MDTIEPSLQHVQLLQWDQKRLFSEVFTKSGSTVVMYKYDTHPDHNVSINRAWYTVKPVLEDQPLATKIMVFKDKWPLVTGSS